MGFWQGLNQGLSEVSAQRERKRELEARIQSEEADREFRRQEAEEGRRFQREMFRQQATENMRGTALEVAMRRQEEAKASRNKVALGVSIGLSETAATALLRSGQLDLFLSQYEKSQKKDPTFVTALNSFVEEKMADAPPEAVSATLLAGISTDRDVSDPKEAELALMEAILAANEPEQLDELYTKLLTTSSTPYTPLPTFEVDFTTLAGPEETETRAIRRELAESLGTYFEGSFSVTDTGDVIVNQSAAPEVQQLFNEAQRRARDMAFGPTRKFTPTDAARAVATSLETAIQGTKGMAKAGDILQNFDTILTDPQAFVSTFTPPTVTVPEPTKPEAVVEGLGDTNMGFGFDVDEEFKQRQ